MTINLPFAVSAVSDRIDEALGAWKVGPGDLAICAGATEGEVMFAEKCLARGAQVRLLILEPTPLQLAQAFRDPSFSEWAARGTARRVLTSHREKARRLSLEILLRRLPIATIILDWDLRVTYRNAAGEELGVLWSLGPQAARSLKSGPHFQIPAELLESCRNLKTLGAVTRVTGMQRATAMMRSLSIRRCLACAPR